MRIFLLLLSTCSFGIAAEPLPLSESYWNDPSFLKSFNGSYRIEARIEPSVTSEERGVLIEMQQLMAAGRRTQSIELLKNSKLTAKSAALLYNLATLQFEAGDLALAKETYQKALEIYPSFRRAHRNLALALIREGEIAKAITHLTEALRLGDAEGTSYGMLGYCRLHQKQYASALQAYRLAQVTEPEVAEWKAGIAQCLQQLNQREDAISLLKEILKERATEASYSVLLANLLLDLERPTEALKALELPYRLGKLSPDETLLVAELRLRQKQPKPSLAAIERAFANPAKLPTESAIVRVIQTSTSLNEWELSKNLLERIEQLEIEHSNPIILASANYLMKSGKDPDLGAAKLDKLLSKEPSFGPALISLAKYKIVRAQPDEAEILLERAAATFSSQYEAEVELAQLLASQARYTEALKRIQNALELESSADLVSYQAALQSLLKASQ